MKTIYLDNAAATPIDTRVLKAMSKAALLYANPSSFNNAARLVRAEIEKSRSTVSKFLNARADEVIFTSSGSEANNLAIFGTLGNVKGGIVLTTTIEHRSVEEPLKRLGIKTKHISVNKDGLVNVNAFEKLLTRDIRLVSVMYANNEIGTIQPIQKMTKIVTAFNKQHGTNILFHTDACQAAGFLKMDVRQLGVDLLSFDGCKIYGPHGIGSLYVKRGTPIKSLIVGAGQEHGLKAGTENIQTIVGLAQAVALIQSKQGKDMAKIRDYTIGKLLTLPDIILNGSMADERLPNNINIGVKDLTSELLLLELDKYGIYAGSGSACMSHSVEPSRVLKAIGVPKDYLNGALRFSLGRETTKSDMDRLVVVLKRIIGDLKKRYER